MPRKPASDSIQGKIDAANPVENEFEAPEGLVQLNEREMVYWDNYSTAKSSWKKSELVELHRLCRFQVQLDDIQAESAKTPFMSSDEKGGGSENAIHKMMRDHAKLVDAKIRVLGLNSPHDVAVKNAKDGVRAQPSRRGKRKPGISLVK